MTGSQLAKNKHLENVKFIRDKLRVCLSIKENTLPAMTSPNVRKVFSNCSNKNCTYSYTIQMESPPSTSTKTAPSQPSHLPERLYLIPRGILQKLFYRYQRIRKDHKFFLDIIEMSNLHFQYSLTP